MANFYTRKHPTHGVEAHAGVATIVYVTVCAKDRKPILANEQTHAALRAAWEKADAWKVGRYVIMPDHLHLFAGCVNESVEVDRWIRFWKSVVSRTLNAAGMWQTDHWDRRLRSPSHYAPKWTYVVQNPVRAGLVKQAVDWPWRGEVESLEL